MNTYPDYAHNVRIVDCNSKLYHEVDISNRYDAVRGNFEHSGAIDSTYTLFDLNEWQLENVAKNSKGPLPGRVYAAQTKNMELLELTTLVAVNLFEGKVYFLHSESRGAGVIRFKKRARKAKAINIIDGVV